MLILGAVLCATSAVDARGKLSKSDSARFQAKLDQIQKNAAAPPRKNAAPRVTTVTDTEVNSYFKYDGKVHVPVGIADPTLHGAGNGRVTGRAIVDLDAVRTQKRRSWTDPLAYLSGRLPITAAGTLTTQNGVGRFQLESAEISGVPVPKSLLQELLSYYSKTPERPAGIKMDDPFTLPSAIREIRIGEGTAAIVQ